MRAGRWAALAALVVSMVVAAAPAGAAPDRSERVQDRAAGRVVAAVLLRRLLEHLHPRRHQQRLGRASAAGRDRQGDHAVRRLPGSPGERGHADARRSTTASRRRTTTSSRASSPGTTWPPTGGCTSTCTPVLKWYRMPKASTAWRMDYRSNDPRGGASAPTARASTPPRRSPLADADGVDFTGYDLIYVVPARNQTAIASSPELNNYAPPDRRRRQRPRQRRRPRQRHVQLGLQAAQPRDRPRLQPRRGLQRGLRRLVRLHGPVGHDGQHHRQRAGLHRLEQVEARAGSTTTRSTASPPTGSASTR